MTTTVPTHGGPAVPASIVTDGKTMGRVATRVYGYTSAAEAAAAGYKCEAGPASSVYVVSAAELASGKFVAEGDPKAIPMYTAPAGMKVEAGYAQPIVIVGGSLSNAAPVGDQWINTPVSILPADLSDNGYSTNQTNYYSCSPLAQFRFKTYATSMDVEVYGNVVGQDNAVNVVVDGVSTTTLSPTQAGTSTFTVSLSAGLKTISLIPCAITATAGTFLTKLTANDKILKLTGTTSERFLIYGDSISIGSSASAMTRDGWAQLLRTARGDTKSTMVEAWGGRLLHDDCDTAPHRQTFANRLASYNPTTIWLAIGTNDYGLVPSWNAADFQTAYADLLDKLIAAIPGVTIYAQSPLYRTTETANTYGSTLADYRAAIKNACVGKTGVTYVNGYAILVSGDLSGDGLHPTTAGQRKIFDYVQRALTGVFQSVVELQPNNLVGKDTFLMSGAYVTYNNGINSNANIGKGDGFTMHGLFQYNLTSIPATATVISANLALYAKSKFADQNDTYSIYRMIQAWVEGTASFTSSTSGATWNTYDGTNNWQTAGATGANDVESSSIGSLLLTSSETINAWKTFNLDAAKVQEWISGSFANNGLLIKSSESVTKNYFVFSTSDDTAANRPKITITYTIPD